MSSAERATARSRRAARAAVLARLRLSLFLLTVLLAAEIHTHAAWITSGKQSFEVGLLSPLADSNQPPQVTLTTPEQGTIYQDPATILLKAEANDPDGAVAKVEFYAESNKLGESTVAPFSLVWLNAPVGAHWLTAIATDNQGSIGVSSPVEIAVSIPTCALSGLNPVAGNSGPPSTAITNPQLVYFGQDASPYPPLGLNEVPRPASIPNSDRASAVFRARLPGTTVETFESYGAGTVPTQLHFGTNTVPLSGNQAILEVTDPLATFNGEFPISGTKALELVGDTGTGLFGLDFADPQAALGFFATDIELNGLKVTLFRPDGTTQVLTVPVTRPQGSGGALFYGIIDAQNPFVRVELGRTGSLEDAFLFDDLSIATAAQLIPEVNWPSVAMSDAAPVTLDGTGPKQALFHVSLSTPLPHAVTVEYFTLDGTAQQGIAYAQTNGLIQFPPGQTLASVAVDILPAGISATNATFAVQLRNPSNALLGRCEAAGLIVKAAVISPANTPPEVLLVRPANRAIFQLGQPIQIEAEASDHEGGIASVEFYVGSTKLGVATTPPYILAWTNAVEGDYVLTARAIDADGATGQSSPIEIAVSDVCGGAALIQDLPDPEINLLQDYLYELGIRSTVFDRAQASITNLLSFDVVVWDDVSSAGLGDREVSLFQQLVSAGKSLYFIGDRLITSWPDLTPAAQVQWGMLLNLQPAAGTIPSTQVSLDRDNVDSVGVGTVIKDGKVGTILDFDYPFSTGGAVQSGSDTVTVLGRVGAFDALVADEVTSEGGSGRRLSQTFRVANGADAASLAERKRLFQNAVWWLLNCKLCSNLNLHPEGTSSPAPIAAGDTLTYTITVEVAGGCEALAVNLISILPPGVEFQNALSRRGQWTYSQGVVTFNLGRLTRDMADENVQILVRPTVAGVLTNQCTLQSLNEAEGALADNVFEIITDVAQGLRLSISPSLAAASVDIRMDGPAGRTCDLEANDGGSLWVPVITVNLPNGSNAVSAPLAAAKRQRIYRGILR